MLTHVERQDFSKQETHRYKYKGAFLGSCLTTYILSKIGKAEVSSFFYILVHLTVSYFISFLFSISKVEVETLSLAYQ